MSVAVQRLAGNRNAVRGEIGQAAAAAHEGHETRLVVARVRKLRHRTGAVGAERLRGLDGHGSRESPAERNGSLATAE